MPRIELQWRVGYSTSADEEPTEWVAATVPGAVQLDWSKAHGWPEWWRNDEYRRYRWMEDVFWTYRAVVPDLEDVAHANLVIDRADHRVMVRLDGQPRAEIAGMNASLRIPLGGYRSGSVIEVVIPPAPSLSRDGTGREVTTQTTKPGVFYGWDFAPRLVPLGLGGAVYLQSPPASQVESSLKLQATVDEGGVGLVTLSTALSDATADGGCRWQVLDPTGEVLHDRWLEGGRVVGSVRLPEVRLWWPNGEGEQPLYTSRLWIDGEAHDRRIGFRTVRLVPYQGMWEESHPAPGSRWEPPMTLEVNGRKLFAKGANWVPPSMFPGSDTSEAYSILLKLCQDAGFNLLRVWGGGGVPNDSFFDRCDEMGLLVWQEFPLACARYEGTEDYLGLLERESTAIVRRLSSHPSLAVWCGGNELFCSWSRMTDQDAAIRLLNKVTYELDPERPFLPTSPVMGVGHGGYTFVDGGREAVRYFQEARCTAYTEFGCAGPASAETIRQIVPDDEIWPPRLGTNWEWHHGFRAWDGNPESWLMLPMLEEYFGELGRLEDLVEAGQLLQAEGMRHIYEEARRQKPRCSMALCWCLNEPWPTVANNCLISWPADPKPAYHAVKEACRPVLASARFPKMRWAPGESMTLEPCLLNDSQSALDATPVELYVEGVFVAQWTHRAAQRATNSFGEPVTVRLPAELPKVFRVEMRCPSRVEWGNAYRFLACA